MAKEQEKRYRWLVKDSMFAPWRELPGEHTATEMWLMRWQQRFWASKRTPDDATETPDGVDDEAG